MIEQLLEAVDASYQPFIQSLHNYLTDNGCKVTVEEKKSGFFASFKHVKLKKSIVNFLFRKAGLLVRIYGENVNKYIDSIGTLPEEMVQSIEKATVCKKLIDPNSCSPTCPTGYDFMMGNKRSKVCRYGGFEFLVTNKNNPYIKSFVEN